MSGRFRALAWLVVLSLLLATVLKTPAQAAASTVDYVAMGDSYSAGVGTPPTDACGRSPLGYAGLWTTANAPASYRFVACGGSTTDDVLKNQLSALDSGTDIVSITIGGNDVGFFPTVSACTAETDVDCEQQVTTGRTAIAQVLPGKLDAVYRAIRQRAPAAKVIVMGYPRLFYPLADCASDGMTTFKRQILNAAADHLVRTIADRAEAAGFIFADVRSAFDGHAACTPGSWINNYSTNVASGPLHPNATGYAQGYLPAFKVAVASTPPAPTPAAFGGNETWTANAYFGNHAPYGAFADVTGDGLADAIIVNNNGISVRRSTGTAFANPETWTTTAYFGDRATGFADVTGEGRRTRSSSIAAASPSVVLPVLPSPARKPGLRMRFSGTASPISPMSPVTARRTPSLSTAAASPNVVPPAPFLTPSRPGPMIRSSAIVRRTPPSRTSPATTAPTPSWSTTRR